ncbi:hypothetical protein ACFWUU_39225 [Kribbella sp. NPDC058693]|uniref:hypothetical protein n=1 Tax=Kribbella sp. NPDC058693 TaxID=3346602 RepID=UPI0036464351
MAWGEKKQPRAVRNAAKAVDNAYQRQEDTAENGRQMRQAMRGTSQIHQTIRSGNAADRSAKRNVKNAEKAYDKAVQKAAEKAAKKNRGR